MSDSQTLDVPSLKVVELREELAKRGLDTKGLKKDVSYDSQHSEVIVAKS